MFIRNAMAAVALLSIGMMYGADDEWQRRVRLKSELEFNEQITMRLYNGTENGGELSFNSGNVVGLVRRKQEAKMDEYYFSKGMVRQAKVIIPRKQGSGIPSTGSTASSHQDILAKIKSHKSYPGTN